MESVNSMKGAVAFKIMPVHWRRVAVLKSMYGEPL